MAIEIPEVDVNSGLGLCDGNMEIYLNALRLYVSSVSANLEKMRGVSEETLKDYSVTVHSVKSTSEYIGAEEARKTAKQLESMARNGDWAGVLARNEAFIQYAQGLVDGIRNWLENRNQGAGDGGHC